MLLLLLKRSLLLQERKLAIEGIPDLIRNYAREPRQRKASAAPNSRPPAPRAARDPTKAKARYVVLLPLFREVLKLRASFVRPRREFVCGNWVDVQDVVSEFGDHFQFAPSYIFLI